MSGHFTGTFLFSHAKIWGKTSASFWATFLSLRYHQRPYKPKTATLPPITWSQNKLEESQLGDFEEHLFWGIKDF